MKAITKLYLRTFLFTAIPFFLLTTFFNSGDINKKIVLFNITASLILGISMSLILVSLHWYLLKKNGVENITDENIGVHQTKTIETKLSKNELIQKLKLNPVIRKMKMTELENGVLLKTGMTIKSWGEEIRIILMSNKENTFEYQISSSPKLKTTIVDYGKNLENINKIERVIQNIT